MKAFSMLASAMLAAAIALPAVAADQTKLYDPMAEAEKIVVPVELLSKDGAKPIGNVVIVKNAYGLAFYPQLKEDRKSTRLNSSHTRPSRMPSSA